MSKRVVVCERCDGKGVLVVSAPERAAGVRIALAGVRKVHRLVVRVRGWR